MIRFASIQLVFVLLAIGAGCGETSDDSGSAGGGAASDIFALPETMFGDSGPTFGKDVGAKDTAELCDFPATPEPGDPGSVCDKPTDCDSGYCIKTAAGKICTRTCVDCCPDGFACEQLEGTDTVFLCLATQQALCRPCVTDKECAELSKDSICVNYGAGGSFCGGGCATDDDCPAAYSCQDATGEKGSAKQCVLKTGECACSPAASQDGAATTCWIKTDSGTCTGQRKCGAKGLSACDAPTPVTEACDKLDNDCDGETDEGFSGLETCNGIDDDCDGEIDEEGASGCKTLYIDKDKDGFGDEALADKKRCLCAPDADHTALKTGDCDDGDAKLFPGAPESCNDLDDDCDGKTDTACDEDHDGFCAAKATVVGLPKACTKGKNDCDDADPAIHPKATESCNKIDDNCDGTTDEKDATGCKAFFEDADKDGFGAGTASCLCSATGLFTSATATDCKDKDAAVNPSKIEICNNGKDDDCDGTVNEEGAKGCTDYYEDKDGDGFGGGKARCLCGPSATHTVLKGKDCDDASKKVSPAATELCNGKDDDCNGKTDEQDAFGCSKHYFDGDGDGFGDVKKLLCLCAPSGSYKTLTAGDCNDLKAAIKPGAKELCNAIDDDCDGKTDEDGATGCKPHFVDGDGDGFGDPASEKCLCKATGAHKALTGKDCDDKKKGVHPAAKEACNKLDDDCDGSTDEASAAGCKPFFQDGDGDGFGDVKIAKCLCQATAPYTAKQPGDCNDKAKPVNPKATEKCDGIDNNCNGATDEQGAVGCQKYYADHDKDNVGDATLAPRCLCKPGNPHAALKAGDCNDKDKTIWPLAPELCDKKDNDCDGVTDEPGAKDCTTFYFDGDGDGWGLKSAKQCACQPIGPYKAKQQHDCNDSDKSISPGESEQCDSKDNDCDGKTDDNVGNTAFYTDKDNDGWGVGAAKKMCKPQGVFRATKSGDCDDNDSQRFPNNPEICDDKDNDCNKLVDDGGVAKKVYYKDGDGDGFGVTGLSKKLCLPDAPYTATKGGDCADNDKTVHPAAQEILCNKKDDDCKGGDKCVTCTGTCAGKCGKNTPAGVEYKQTCLIVLGITVCYPPVAFNCYCDKLCAPNGDCCKSYTTCCK